MGKLGFYRDLIVQKLNARTLDRKDLGRLVFGQQHYGTQNFFIERYGQCHTIGIDHIPHYQFLEKDLDKIDAENIYTEYLKCSWEYLYRNKKSRDEMSEKVSSFVDLYRKVEKSGMISDEWFSPPVCICERPDGKLILVDGNHRAAIAYKLGLDLKVYYLDPKKYLFKTALVPDEFYGSKRLSMPYQSLFDGDRELVRGRRPDIYERMCHVRREDIEGKNILEYGCNIGGNCFVAGKFGAKSLLGIDYSPKIISAAIRMNAYFATPASFLVHDLNYPLDGLAPADTVFCFSVINHLQNKQVFADTLLRTTKDVLYFEGHSKTRLEDYAYVLNSDNFASIEHVGDMRDGIHNDKRRRPLFRCVIRKDG